MTVHHYEQMVSKTGAVRACCSCGWRSDLLTSAPAARTEFGHHLDTVPRLFVVCASHERFRAWCIDNDRSPHDPTVKLVRAPENRWHENAYGLQPGPDDRVEYCSGDFDAVTYLRVRQAVAS